MSKSTQPESDEVATAEAAVSEAEAEVARIEEALIEGADDVTAADLVAAEHDVEAKRGLVARARDIVRRRTERAAEQARLARLAELDETVRTMFGRHDGDVVDAFDAAVAALTPLVEAVQAHNAGLKELVEELLAVQPLPAHLDPQRDRGIRLPHLDVTVAPLDAATLMTEAAWRAASAAGDSEAVKRLGPGASISRDLHQAIHVGLAEPWEGPGSASGRQGPPSGPSDRLRRVSRLVAERDAR